MLGTFPALAARAEKLAVISAREVAGSEAPACLGRPFLPNS